MGAHGARRTVGGFLPSPSATVLWVEGLAPLILGGSLSDKGGLVPADSLCQMLCSTGVYNSRARAMRTYMRGGVNGTIVPESVVRTWRLPR